MTEWGGYEAMILAIWVAFRVRLRVDSEVSLQCYFAQFVFRVCLRSASKASPTSEWREGRQKALLNWLPVQPIRIVLLVANGSPPMEAAIFQAENFIQSREVDQISPRHLRGCTLNTALVP